MSPAGPAVVPTLDVERALAAACGPGERIVVGIDEVGRGALAGPVTLGACAVRAVDGEIAPLPAGVRDSKRLTARRREALVEPIRESALAVATGWASAAEIDEAGIMTALTRAALRALDGLELPDGARIDAILLDGDADVLTPALVSRGGHVPRIALQVSADRDCASVAAASVVAKVARDAHMVALDEELPAYSWAGNKGYGSAAHREAIDALGASDHHRRSWRLGSAPKPARSPAPAPVRSSARVQAPVRQAPLTGVLWDDPDPGTGVEERE